MYPNDSLGTALLSWESTARLEGAKSSLRAGRCDLCNVAGGASCDLNREIHEKDRHRVISTPKHEVASLLNVITTAAETAEEPAVNQDTAMDRVVDSNEIRRQRC